MSEPILLQRPRLAVYVLTTGLLAGTMDILGAMTSYSIRTGRNPMRVLDFVASGVFGREALTGDESLAAWGLLFHYFIAFSWTVLFYFLYPRVKLFQGDKIWKGIGYGIFVWMGMNLVVVPLSNAPKAPFNVLTAIQAMGILIVCIGLPISILANKYYVAVAGKK